MQFTYSILDSNQKTELQVVLNRQKNYNRYLDNAMIDYKNKDYQIKVELSHIKLIKNNSKELTTVSAINFKAKTKVLGDIQDIKNKINKLESHRVVLGVDRKIIYKTGGGYSPKTIKKYIAFNYFYTKTLDDIIAELKKYLDLLYDYKDNFVSYAYFIGHLLKIYKNQTN